MKQQYKVGQKVRLTRAAGDAVGVYEILRQYPSDSGELLYRVRAVVGTQERMVREGEIVAA